MDIILLYIIVSISKLMFSDIVSSIFNPILFCDIKCHIEGKCLTIVYKLSEKIVVSISKTIKDRKYSILPRM